MYPGIGIKSYNSNKAKSPRKGIKNFAKSGFFFSNFAQQTTTVCGEHTSTWSHFKATQSVLQDISLLLYTFAIVSVIVVVIVLSVQLSRAALETEFS